MTNTMRIIFLLLSLLTASSADTTKTYELVNQTGGASTPYVLHLDQYAVTYRNNRHSKVKSVKKVEIHPSYKLYFLRNSLTQMNTNHSSDSQGNVYYKYGIEDASHRYISTGEVLVTFTPISQQAMKELEQKYKLQYVKQVKPDTVLYRNRSEKNDIDLSSALIQLPNIIEAKPNWILPLRLF
ncbi:hypothetical protein [Sulfurovum sp.]|uniref:hypothetical protein n=1 Tax=Sulfurovum sp. TaxID=1969726 RepID=UPI0025FCFD87|nr:hypothetical protein [Sulfurovum sp.]